MFCWPSTPRIIFCKYNKLGVQIFLICLLLFSTCFGQLCAHHQEKIPYLCDTWYVSLYIDDCYAGHTKQSSIWKDKYQVSHKYGIFSWWWAHSCPKHVQKSNKHIKKICAPNWFYLQKITVGVAQTDSCVLINYITKLDELRGKVIDTIFNFPPCTLMTFIFKRPIRTQLF